MTCGKCKDSVLEKKVEEREKIINKISNFAVGSLLSVAWTITSGKTAWYGIQTKQDKYIYVGGPLLAVGIAATVYCFNKIKKGFRELRYFY